MDGTPCTHSIHTPNLLASINSAGIMLGRPGAHQAASERLADLLYLFGDWPGGVRGQGEKCPEWKFSRGLFLSHGKGAKHYGKPRKAKSH